MLTLDTIQTALVAADNKTARWAIKIFDTAGTGYGYYTDAIGADGWATDEAWGSGEAWSTGIQNDVVIMDFNGIELRRNSSESGIIAPSDLTFSMSNPDTAYNFTLFKGGTVFVELFLWNPTYGERKIQGWKFNIKTCEPGYQKLKFTCEDFLQKYLRGDYPNTRIPEDVFKSSRDYQRKNVCIPVPFGTAYVPLRDVYIEDAVTLTASDIACVAAATSSRAKITGTGLSVFGVGNLITIAGFTTSANNGNFTPLKISATEIEFDTTAFVDEAAGDSVTLTQNQPFFMLGDTTNTYTITKIHSPKDPFGDNEWSLTPSTAIQSTHADSDGVNWRLFKALIVDDDNDGVNETPGFFKIGSGPVYDPIVQLTRSDTVLTTNPADVIAFVLKDMGIPASDIDEAGTFASCHTTFDGYAQPLLFNGAFWYKQPREKVLSQLLIQCHSCLDVGETIQLRVLNAAQAGDDITSADILRSSDQGEGSFTYRDLLNEDYTDSAYIAWRDNGTDGKPNPQDSFLKILVAADAVANVIPKDVLECPFVQDSQNIQRIGRLYAQRKTGKVATTSFLSKGTRLAHQPDDVLRMNGANYGGTYYISADSMKINKDCSIQFGCTKYSYTLEDWADLTPTALTIPVDDTTNTWQPTISGPQTDQDIGRSAYTVWGQEWLKVGPIANQGQFTDIQKALNAVKQAGGGAIYILNGSYSPTSPIYFPDVDINIVGQSRGGVVISPAVDTNLFQMASLSSKIKMSLFTIDASSSGSAGIMFNIYGLSAFSKSAIDIKLEQIDMDITGGAYGIEYVYGSNRIGINDLKIDGDGGRVINTSICENVIVKDNRINNGLIYGYRSGSEESQIIINNNIMKGLTRYSGIVCGGIGSIVSGNILDYNSSDAITSGVGNFQQVIGIRVDSSRSSIIDNKISCSNTNSPDIYFIGIVTQGGYHKITKNTVNTSLNSTGICKGIVVDGANSTVEGNILTLINTIASTGIHLDDGFVDSLTINGNSITLNSQANDTGIYIPSGADNNKGSGNVFTNCGKNISDSGTGNLINKSGGGTF